MFETYSELFDRWKLFFQIRFSKTFAWISVKIRILAYCDLMKAFTTFIKFRNEKKIHHFFLFDQPVKVTKTQHVKFASQKEPFQEHMSVGVKFLDDLLHLESVVLLTTKKLPWCATVPPYLPFWTARLFLRLNHFNFKHIFTQKLTQMKLISKKTTIHFSEADWGDEAQATSKLKTKLTILSVSKEKD